ncbi:BLUF domain-containing protein [Flavobacterium algicola]|uniref:BLUF domain-containing protein n=1 Tax=Flavobacterium algicola TaxID=556529 RepID=UPI001EFDAE04|nr:BLUF domain-containing protein [Flavobacterium algicola]MCG9791900.1 BLUF domain-containing protein [Flavobacterium algicola]
MYQLNYRSISREGLELKDLNDILDEAIAFNASKNISGCLIYHNDNFVQILEGEKKDVLDVYERVKKDKRHHSVTLLWETAVQKRHFAEWNMAYYNPNEKNMKQFVTNFLLLSSLSDRNSGALLSFWASVRKILNDGSKSPETHGVVSTI